MLSIIITFILHCGISFLLHYCCDTAKIWVNDDQPNIYMPKLTDLRETNNVYTMQKYTTEVISPAYHYFIIKREIENHLENEGCSIELNKSTLLLSTSLLFASSLRNLDFLTIQWLYIVIALVVGGLSYFLTLFIYKKTNLPILNFEYSIKQLKEEGSANNEYDTEFNLSENDAINNYIIMKHSNYIRYIYDTVVFRSSLKRVLFAISVILYVLFFMRLPY